jgi:hypothetical protein
MDELPRELDYVTRKLERRQIGAIQCRARLQCVKWAILRVSAMKHTSFAIHKDRQHRPHGGNPSQFEKGESIRIGLS